MQKYIGEEQYAMNRWGYFREKKISQFFQNQLGRHYKRKQFYLGILDVFFIVIVRFMMKREERLVVTALILVMIKMVMNYKFNWQGIQSILNLLIDFSLGGSILSFSRENENEFLLRNCVLIWILGSKEMVMELNWFDLALVSGVKYSLITLVRWGIIQDYSIQKLILYFCTLLFYIGGLSLIIGASQFTYSRLWIKYEKLKKQTQLVEKILYEIPVGVVVFNNEGNVVFQNQMAQQYIPKDVDIINRCYSNETNSIQHMLLSKNDMIKFEEQFQIALQSDNLVTICCGIEGHPLPVQINLVKQIWNKTPVILSIIYEISTESQLLYDRISQTKSLTKLISLGELISKEKVNNHLIQALFPMHSKLHYQQKDEQVSNIRNYLLFLQDYMQLIYDIPMKMKMGEIPTQVLIDIVRYHSVITQLLDYVYVDHHKKQQMLQLSQKQLIHSSADGLRPQVKDNNFSLLLITALMENETILLTFDIEYKTIIKDFEMIFLHFTNEQLQDSQFRIEALHSTNIELNSFIHIAHQIFQVGGNFTFIEKLTGISLTLTFPLRIVDDYEEVLFDNYESTAAIANSLPPTKSETHTMRVKSSQYLVTSTQRIGAFKKIEEPRVQTSLSEFRTLNFHKCQDIIIKPNPGIITQEETSAQVSRIRSPGLSPIIKGDTNLNLDEKIQHKMHHIEKAVSKTLEQILSEIMNYRGRKVNVHLKSAKPKQRSFENSPNVAHQQKETQSARQQSVPSVMRSKYSEQKTKKESDITQSNIIPKNTGSQFLKNMREEVPKNNVVMPPVEQSKSPSFLPQSRPITFNEIESTDQTQPKQLEKISSKQGTPKDISIDYKLYYNDILTFLMIDDSSMAQCSIAAMKFAVPKKFDTSGKSEHGLKAIQDMLAKQKLYHFILIKLKMPIKDGFQLIDEIRKLEIQHNMPKQHIIALDCDMDQQMMDKCISAGYDEVAEKPLKQPQIEEFIQKSMLDL